LLDVIIINQFNIVILLFKIFLFSLWLFQDRKFVWCILWWTWKYM